jgi:hypothetical protein
MRTGQKLGWAGCALLALGISCQGAESGGKQGGPDGCNIEQRAREHEERIAQHIRMIREMLEKHPNAPAAVKSAAHKLIKDLVRAKEDLGKLLAAAKSHNKTEVKACMEALKQDHEAVKADHEALKDAIQSSGEHRAQPDAKKTAL